MTLSTSSSDLFPACKSKKITAAFDGGNVSSHGGYDKYCLLPLYVFCGDQILTSYLRPSNIDAAKHAEIKFWNEKRTNEVQKPKGCMKQMERSIK